MEVNPSLDLKMAKRLTYDNLVVTIYLDRYFIINTIAAMIGWITGYLQILMITKENKKIIYIL